MLNAVNNSRKQRGRPFKPGTSGNMRGRPKGSRNKRTRSLIEAAEAGGETPLDYMLRVMRDSASSAKRRDEMARAAAPYLHPKLSPIVRPERPAEGGRADEIRIVLVRPPKRDPVTGDVIEDQCAKLERENAELRKRLGMSGNDAADR
jgi:hypothetical protein